MNKSMNKLHIELKFLISLYQITHLNLRLRAFIILLTSINDLFTIMNRIVNESINKYVNKYMRRGGGEGVGGLQQTGLASLYTTDRRFMNH